MMDFLATTILVLLVVGSLWFETWKRSVVYPDKPIGLQVVSFTVEIGMAALCLAVLFT